MTALKQRIKKLVFGLLGKEPEAVVVSFLTGDETQARAMADEVRRLEPTRRHFVVVPDSSDSAWLLWAQLRRRFRTYRIGLAPVLFDGSQHYRSLRWAAWMLAPNRVLAYNARGERHHLTLRTLVSSILFLHGIPLDRIFLRPAWLCPWKKDRTVVPTGRTVLDGRPLAEYRPRVAVLTPYLPWPLAHGGAVRIYNLLREAAHEFDIFLFAFAEGEEECGPLLDICARVILVGKPRYREPRWSTWKPPEVGEYRSHAMHSAIKDLRREFAFRLLQVEYTQLAEYPGDILVEHDVTFDLYRQIHTRDRTLSSWWNYQRWLHFERTALRRYPSVVLMSEKDRDLVAQALSLPSRDFRLRIRSRTSRLLSSSLTRHKSQHECRLGRHECLRHIPNGVDLQRYQPVPEPDGQHLLFIGSFRHFPNIVAYRFFTEKIWPPLCELFPQIQLTAVAGPDPHIHWRSFAPTDAPSAHPRIQFLSYVADVRPLYEAANIVVVPTLVSAGTNVKVLEAMAMERAVVSTTSGCAGLGLEHRSSVWIADTPEGFTTGISQLLQDPALRAHLARNARLHAKRHYDWRRLGEAQRTLWHELLGDTIATRTANPSDIEAISSIQAASPQAAVWEPSSYLEHDCRIALTSSQIVGFLCLRRTASDEHEILNLAVAPEARRQGVATTLLQAALEGLTGAVFLEVRESNTAARELYTKLGFETSGIRENYYSAPPESAIVLRFQSC